MPYFYVSRNRPPSPFGSSTTPMAGVIEADDLAQAKERFATAYTPVVEKGLGSVDEFDVVALDEQPRGDHGFVIASFTQQD